MEKTWAYVKINGKTLKKRVHPRGTWYYPTIAATITGILMCLVLILLGN